MHSKPFYAFKMKIDKFDDDIDFVDIIRIAALNGDLSSASGSKIFDRVDPQTHSHLARRKNAEGGRKLVANHLRNTVFSSYVKDIYEEVTHYLRDILRCVCTNGFDTDRLVGEHSIKMNARDILRLGSWDALCKEVSDSVFQNLESERSTPQLLRKVRNKLGIDVDDCLIEAALPYLEARHLLVHSDGIISSSYQDKYPKIRKKGDKIDLSLEFITDLRRTVRELVEAIDQSVLDKELLNPNQRHGVAAD